MSIIKFIRPCYFHKFRYVQYLGSLLADAADQARQTSAPYRINRHEPAESAGVVARLKVIQAGLGIAFFAGEFVGQKCVSGYYVVHKGQRVVGVFSCARSRSSW